jgi:hypothetical protein
MPTEAYALCPMPYALCPRPSRTSYESSKGYSLLFFLVAFAHGIYVIRTENWRFSQRLIAYLLASEAATIILA